jgi:hypothetical protein
MPKKRSNLAIALRCVFAFVGLRAVYGVLVTGLVFATKGGNSRLFNLGACVLALAFGIGLTFLVLYFAAEFKDPLAAKLDSTLTKLGMGTGIGLLEYFGYEWVLAVAILPIWYLFWRRGRFTKQKPTHI